jgi:steroid delta-isomerase-like uncharacterized protein
MGVGKDLWTEIETIYSKLDYEGLASLYASDAVHIDSTGRHEGREAIGAYLEGADKPFTDISMETSLLIEEDETVAAEYMWRATNTGPLTMPDGTQIPATGKKIDVPIVSVVTVRDGKIVHWRDYFDSASMMTQLGLMPGS